MFGGIGRLVLTVLVWVGVLGVCFGEASEQGVKRPSVVGLLKKYAENQDKLRSFIIKSESLMDADNRFTAEEWAKKYSGKRKRKVVEELRYDGKRISFRGQVWDEEVLNDKFNPIGEYKYTSYLYDGKDVTRLARERGGGPGDTVSISRNISPPYAKERILAGSSRQLMGIYGAGAERIDSLLRRADTISVRDTREVVGGVQCYVIDAATKGGRYSLWIDPEHGYNIAKISRSTKAGDVIGGNARNSPSFFTTEFTRFENVDSMWVPMESVTEVHTTYINGDFEKRTTRFKVTEIIINPNHDALRSFAPDDIPNGTRTFVVGIRGRHSWQDGNIVDKQGRVVIKAKGEE